MAESNPTQVILTDDGLKIIKAQNTADNATSGVTNLNDPNLMSVIEKQTQASQYAGLTSQYNVLIQNAKDEGIDTTDLTTAYTNLNAFMAAILTDTTKASDVDRVTYKKYQDTYNEELAKLQSALQSNANNKFTSAASAASQAASTANAARSAATSAYDYATSEIAVQSAATAKAQSTADSAFSQAVTAIDNGQATSQAVTDLKDGSTMTIAELQNGLAAKVSNSDYASYKDQTASQIGQLVTNSAFSAYQQTTAELISAKVATKDFSAYQATTDKAISSKVESNDFNSYKEQTAKEFSSTIEAVQTQVTDSAVGTNLVKDSEQEFTGKAYDFHDYNLASITELTPDKTYTMSFSVKVDDKAVNCQQQVFIDISNPSWGYEKRNYVPISTDYQRVTYTFTIPEGQTGVAVISAYLTHPVINGTSDPSSDKSDVAGTGYIKEFKIEKGSHATDYSISPEDTATQSQFTQLSGDMDLRVKKGDLIDQINIQAGNTLISSSGQLTLSGKTIYFDTANPVIIPSANIDSLLVGKKLTAANISANTFTTNNETFTVDQSGLVTATSLVIRGSTNLVYNAALLGNNGSDIPGWDISNNGVCWSNVTHDGVPSIGWNNTTGVWTNFAQTKMHPLNGATGQPFSASVWFKEDGSDTSLIWNLTLAFFDSNGSRVSFANQTWNGIGSEQDWRYVTINNAVAPSNAVYVGLQYWSYNGHGNACFSSPMLTQTAQSTGYQPDTGNVVSAGEIDGSVINGSTINTPNLNLGFNGTFTEDFDYTQDSSKFLPKKNKGTLTFNHGVLQSKGNMQTYVNGQWGGMNDSLVFQSGIDNSQWTEVAPGYIKLDSFKQNDIDLAQRTYTDPTGFYYTSATGDKSYLGNVLQTSQVQTPSLIGKYIGPSAGQNLLQIVNNGNDYGLQVGSYGGGEGVLSDFIYNTTSSGSSNVHITENGRLVRSTSASKYKYNIKNPDIETTLGDRLLNVHMATWNDKRAVDMYAEQLSTGEEREKSSIDKYYGLIAEQLRDAGLDMFISYGKNHEIEGIQYDRAWVPLLSVIRRLNDKVNEYELRLSKLEGVSK